MVDYFDCYYETQDDPYLETRAREERFVSQIVTAVEAAMEKTLPAFLAGCIAGLTVTAPPTPPITAEVPEPPNTDVDWDFLGG